MNMMCKTIVLVLLLSLAACSEKKVDSVAPNNKVVVYQVMTRLFGNTNSTNKPWGTKEENGVGKFNDFTDKALKEIHGLGVTHMWYTGVPHHALIGDYTQFGISNDDPDVVKGRAGSPYAVKDYYQVNPDLAVDVAHRLDEFKALINRTHKNNMKVIIDIVPNHVARAYKGLNNPEGVRDFGADDDLTLEYALNNNFYYVPQKAFKVPVALDNYKPLGGEQHPEADGFFDENPAKWTGNGSRLAQPHHNDWYETVKINFGVRPDGTKDFPELPKEYKIKDFKAHYQFWLDKTVPSSWLKFRDIAYFWLSHGVDGFRYDMAEMVPVELWSFMNSSIKMKNEDAFLLAEVYQPHLYRDYIHLGKMDYLYDKVQLYDSLKSIMQGKGSVAEIAPIQKDLRDIEHHMLHFLENHDEQRIASPEFADSAEKGKPALVVSALISTAPTMIYFGQELGEQGGLNSGFGTASRTSIFDYAGVPEHQKWMNNGAFDGALLSNKQKALRNYYKEVLNLSRSLPAFDGAYFDLYKYNSVLSGQENRMVYAFARFKAQSRVIVLANFSDTDKQNLSITVPNSLIKKWNVQDGNYELPDLLEGKRVQMTVSKGVGKIKTNLQGLESSILLIE